MSLNHPPADPEQSPGADPKSSKRNSGLFAFFKWFKPSTSRESINSDVQISNSSSCDSLASIQSGGTIASFSFVPPNAYPANNLAEKCINPGPETDTYKARLKQRDKRRENDRNLTLRKKYNLFFNRETLLKNVIKQQQENTKSLPLMTKAVLEEQEDRVGHRRTNSESSKTKKAGAYLHVKGKRKAPPPPKSHSTPSTMSLKRKKRLAPLPPEKLDKAIANTDIICNDSLKLDHGILKPAKELESKDQNSPSTSARSSYVETPVSPRPWYKRNTQHKEKKEKEHKYELVEKLPETQFLRNSTLDLTLEDAKEVSKVTDKKKEEKRKSGISYLANISELDREASEIIRKEQQKNGVYDLQEMPEFMKPRDDPKINTDSWASPKRRSARDLIAKFNAITNVTKVTVFGTKDAKKDYFGKQHSLDETKRQQETLLESHKKRIEQIDKKHKDNDKFNVLMKSESASAIKTKPETPKLERKSWNCAKCNVENDYWRIICHVCSNIKPYFDDFYPNKLSDTKLNEPKTASPLEVRKTPLVTNESPERVLERSKTQIGFSALANYNAANNKKKSPVNEKSESEKKEEKEKLKKMLIEMKNSLPKRKSNILMKQNSRASIIIENPENTDAEIKEDESKVVPVQEEKPPVEEKTQEQRVAEILIATKETIYENIKVKKTDNPKPVKVSSSAQTSAVVKQVVPPNTIANIIKNEESRVQKNNFELMRPKDFEDIYSDKNAKSAARIYANLAQSDELSLFFNVPKKISELKNDINLADANTDTIEINRLLRRLETAIAKGDLTEAAIFAKELAQLKVNCSVVRKKGANGEEKEKKVGFQIEMYVEDKISHRGPFPIQVTENQTVAQLKQQIEREFEIPVDVQRWILGKELVTNDNASLKEHNVTSEGCPVFLYLVAPDLKNNADKRKSQILPLDDKPSTSKQDTAGSGLKINVDKTYKNSTENIKQELEKQSGDHTPKIVDVIPKIIDTKPEIKVEQNKESKVIVEKTKKTESTIATTTKVPEPNKVEIKAKEVIKTDVQAKESTNQVNNGKKIIKPNSITIFGLPADALATKTSGPLKTDANKNIPTTTSIFAPTSQTTKKTEFVIPVIKEVKPLEKDKQISTTSSSTQSNASVLKTITNKVEEKQNAKPAENKVTNIRTITSVPNKNTAAKPEIVKSDLMIASITSHPPVLQHKLVDETIEIKVEKNNPKAAGPSGAQPKKAVLEEDFDDYESKTLKPEKEWECHLCTLLNPTTTNICGACATIRLKSAPKKSVKRKAPQPKKDQTYLQLVNLDNADLVENAEPFECVICFLEVPAKEGVTLRECLHQFCKMCLAHTIEYSEEAEVKCPYRDDDYSCNIALQDREIKALVTKEVYDQFLAKSIAQAENKIDKSFHCKTPDCKGWCIFEDNVNEFRCPVCRKVNCLTCQAIHMGVNCKQYQERMTEESEIDEDAKRTKEMIDEMVRLGEALACPTCKVVLLKKWGCDWLRCSMCKTEICWVTRGPRWGPAGKGDTSGGCQCGVNGVKCHPKCNYCH